MESDEKTERPAKLTPGTYDIPRDNVATFVRLASGTIRITIEPKPPKG